MLSPPPSFVCLAFLPLPYPSRLKPRARCAFGGAAASQFGKLQCKNLAARPIHTSASTFKGWSTDEHLYFMNSSSDAGIFEVSLYVSYPLGSIHKVRTHRGGGGRGPKSVHSKGGCVNLVLRAWPKCVQGGGGGLKSRKICVRT